MRNLLLIIIAAFISTSAHAYLGNAQYQANRISSKLFLASAKLEIAKGNFKNPAKFCLNIGLAKGHLRDLKGRLASLENKIGDKASKAQKILIDYSKNLERHIKRNIGTAVFACETKDSRKNKGRGFSNAVRVTLKNTLSRTKEFEMNMDALFKHEGNEDEDEDISFGQKDSGECFKNAYNGHTFKDYVAADESEELSNSDRSL